MAACSGITAVELTNASTNSSRYRLASGKQILEPCSGHGKLFTRMRQAANKEKVEDIGDLDYIGMFKFAGSLGLTFSLSSRINRNFVLIPSSTHIPNHGFGRIPDRHWIDSTLPKLWKDTCQTHHNDRCENPMKLYTLTTILPTWLVDVHSLCITPGRSGVSYVALSYRWGQTGGLQLRKDCVLDLQKPFALSSLLDRIPETITNAIDVVRLLGERYLWVDSLCISQDDYMSKSREIDQMGAIYANASVTIVAADGEDADHGLRGLRTVSQQRNLDIESLVVEFGETEKLICTDLGFGTSQGVRSPYFTRGWVNKHTKLVMAWLGRALWMFLHVEPQDPSELEEGRPEFAHLCTAEGQFAGVLSYQNSLDKSDLTAMQVSKQTVEVVATSRGYVIEVPSGFEGLWRHFWVRSRSLGAGAISDGEELINMQEWYNVLWVQWEKGIAYRRCLGRVLKDVWEAQEPEPVSLMLG
ncbi:hypothetical protein FKW77_007203 [Venturia effusa]|uniref:Heterokaryon incompatibility domain-containing protein n=1 Tax=Venturia effusa TaxID=50376 RepID=A0A517LE88_9PEZI|nr:hypothetical protein FKW77_007203 [Venturia effusa]